MPPVTFVGSVCKIHAVGVLCSKITDVHVIEVHDVRTWKFVCFRKIFRFLLHNTTDVTRGKRETIPWALNLCWGPKSYNVISTFFKTVHLFPKDVRFEHGGPNLFLSPGPILPRYAPAHHDCLAKMAKFVYKNTCPSVTNYLIQNAVDYQSHLTIENNLKVEKKKYYFENKHYFPPPNAWSTRRDKHTKELESNNYTGTLLWKVFIASQRHWKWSGNIWKREVCSESMTDLSCIQFFVRNATISR